MRFAMFVYGRTHARRKIVLIFCGKPAPGLRLIKKIGSSEPFAKQRVNSRLHKPGGCMRGWSIAGIAGVVMIAVASGQPAIIWDLYQQVYPADPIQRDALDRCAAEDQGFVRLDPVARSDCYRNHRALGQWEHASSQTVLAANPIDLQRAAAVGSMPRNDIRAAQQNDRFLHPVATYHPN